MIAVDASAVLAILLTEPEAPELEDLLLRAGGGLISPVNHWEVMVRAFRTRGAAGLDAAQALIEALGIEVASAGEADSWAATEAFVRFGKGVGGRLNMGDCFAYALARREGGGLLFKGDDFTQTDLAAPLPSPPGVHEA